MRGERLRRGPAPLRPAEHPAPARLGARPARAARQARGHRTSHEERWMSTNTPQAARAGAWLESFPGNTVWSNATLMTKSMAHCNAVSMAEIDEVIERLRVRQDEPDA